MSVTHKDMIISSAIVAMKESRELADKLFSTDKELHHTALVMHYSIDNLLNALESATINAMPEEHVNALALMRESIDEATGTINSQSAILDKQKVLLGEQQDQLLAMEALQHELTKTTDKLIQVEALNRHLESEVTALKEKMKNEKKALSTLKIAHSSELESEKKKAKDRSKQANDKLKEKHQKSLDKISNLEREITELARDLQRMNGAPVSNNRYSGKTKGVEFFIHEYSSPLQIKFQTANLVKQLPNAMWHFQVMRSNGVSINVGPTTWCTPVLPDCELFSSEWNPKISQRLHELMLERAAESHPVEYKRTLAAKQHPITTNSLFTELEKKSLQKAKLITLFDSISLTYGAFENQMLTSCKKLTPEECIAIRIKIEMIGEDFVNSVGINNTSEAAIAA